MTEYVVDPFDGPEIAQVIGQVVTALGLIAVGWIANRARKDAKVVRDQVENEHQNAAQPNLREDLDAKEKAAEARDKERKKQLDRIERQGEKTAAQVDLLTDGYMSNRSRIESLEDTDRRERQMKATWGPPPQTRRDRRERDDAW